MPSWRLGALEDGLAALGEEGGRADTVDLLLRSFEGSFDDFAARGGGGGGGGGEEGLLPRGSPLRPALREVVDECFAGDSVEAVQEALQGRLGALASPSASPSEELELVRAALAALAAGSPTSLKVTLRLLQEGRLAGGLPECLRTDYRLVCRFLEAADFGEGVRAALVDKDRQPRWQPPELAAVDAAAVDAYFRPLPPAEDLAEGDGGELLVGGGLH